MTAVLPPPISPTCTIVPSGRTAWRLRSTSSPPIDVEDDVDPGRDCRLQLGEPIGRAPFEHEVGTEFGGTRRPCPPSR